MNWARYKLLLISGVLTLVACAGLTFWILSGASRVSSLEDDIKSLERRQTQLTSSNPYPSEANLKAYTAEQDKVRERRDSIRKAIQEGQVVAPEVARPRFADHLREVVPGLREVAAASTKGGENGVILRDPDFGLTKYLEGDLPPQNVIKELVKEIAVMDHLSRLLFDAGISELISIEVVQPDEDDHPARRPGNPIATGPVGFPGGPGGQPGTTASEDLAADAARAERDRMFEVLTYRIEFKAYEDFFWETLNALLADSNQVAIASLAVTNSNELLWPEYLKPVGKGATTTRTRRPARPERRRPGNDAADLLGLLQGSSAPGRAAAVEEEKIPGLVDRRQYLVGGDLLHVVVELKVFRLRPREGESAEPSQGA